MRERYGKRNGIEKNIVVISNITLEPYFLIVYGTLLL